MTAADDRRASIARKSKGRPLEVGTGAPGEPSSPVAGGHRTPGAGDSPPEVGGRPPGAGWGEDCWSELGSLGGGEWRYVGCNGLKPGLSCAQCPR